MQHVAVISGFAIFFIAKILWLVLHREIELGGALRLTPINKMNVVTYQFSKQFHSSGKPKHLNFQLNILHRVAIDGIFEWPIIYLQIILFECLNLEEKINTF